MENSKQPISPTTYTRCGEGNNDFKPLKDGEKTGYEIKFGGLTKREYFAGLAMQGLIANQRYPYSSARLTEMSVEMADALLNALSK